MMKWLFLVHQVHTNNSRERVKVWRAIRRSGATLYRNSVYVLPYGKEQLEDLQWVCQQINDSKGEASVFVSSSDSRKEDRFIQNLFQQARGSDYAAFLVRARHMLRRIPGGQARKGWTANARASFEKSRKQLHEELEEIRKIDFFSHPARKEALQIMNEISARLSSSERPSLEPVRKYSRKDFQKKRWATRQRMHIDRIGSAWLIRRFIDPHAKFLFKPEDSMPSNAILFDVYGSEFGHHGDNCTFETLVKVFGVRDRAVHHIAEIIHDIDLKDHKYSRSEATGVDLAIRSLAETLQDDHRLLEIGSLILDGLYSTFSRK